MAFGGFFGGGGSNSDKNSSDSSSDDNKFTPTTNPMFSGPPVTTSGSTDSAEIKARVQNMIVTESNVINARYLIQKINENCFEQCIPDPQSSLSSKENTCLSTCMEKYIEAWNTTSKTYVGRLQREGANMAGMLSPVGPPHGSRGSY